MRFLIFVLASLILGQPQAVGAAAIIKDIRIGIHSDKTRVVLDLSMAITHQIFFLSDPYRIVMDLPDIQWRTPPQAALRKGGLIAGLRYGQFQPGNARVVLDLTGPGIVGKSFIIPASKGHGPRLVIDIHKASHRAFMAASQSPPKRITRPPLIIAKPKLRPKPGQHLTRRPLVVIDPGHGGVDPGAIGISGVFEKRVTLKLALQVQKAILAMGRQRVRLTRSRDQFVPLRRRVAMARAAGADLFVSIHADSIANRKIRGGGVYTLSENASDKESAALAAKENRADLIAGLDLKGHDDEVTSILIELTQRETMNYSAQFAAALVPELRQLIHMRRRPHRFAGFMVLKAPDVPSVLIETGYLSNRRDEKMLTSPRFRAAIAQAIARAVDEYFKAQNL